MCVPSGSNFTQLSFQNRGRLPGVDFAGVAPGVSSPSFGSGFPLFLVPGGGGGTVVLPSAAGAAPCPANSAARSRCFFLISRISPTAGRGGFGGGPWAVMGNGVAESGGPEVRSVRLLDCKN